MLDSGRFILGPEVEAFEREFAEYLGVQHVVGVANGTDAITIALRALWASAPETTSWCRRSRSTRAPRRSPTPARGRCSATSIPRLSASPRRRWSAALTPSTRAVIAVDLFGRVAPVDELRAAGSPAAGSRCSRTPRRPPARVWTGSAPVRLGDVATFSFFPSKNLFCLGDGGAIVTGRPASRGARARLLRFHGSRDKSSYEPVGWNSRLDALQAAVLRVTLARLDGWNERRRALAAAYARAGLARPASPCREPAEGEEPVHHLFVTRAEDPDALAARLADAGIASRSYYRVPVHRQPAMARMGAGRPTCPERSRRRAPTSPCRWGRHSARRRPRRSQTRWRQSAASQTPCKQGLHGARHARYAALSP